MAPEIHDLQELRDRVSELEMELLRHRSEERRSGEMAFRLLVDAAPVMIWIAGPDSLCTYFNKSWLDFRGRSMEQEVGNGWAEGLHPDDRDLCLATYQKSFFARQSFRMEYRLQRADGEFRWMEGTGVPRFDEETFSGFMGSAADVTVRRNSAFTPEEEAVRLVFSLTEREREVLILIADGRSTKEAALRLGISYKTADSHRSRILEKLGVHETASMVRYAIRAGLIAP
jgi:PAS domain S-box-containing protein